MEGAEELANSALAVSYEEKRCLITSAGVIIESAAIVATAPAAAGTNGEPCACCHRANAPVKPSEPFPTQDGLGCPEHMRLPA
eukprot:scaffold693_cov399-Prasinococcus_capsulatus_cf.AAC.15